MSFALHNLDYTTTVFIPQDNPSSKQVTVPGHSDLVLYSVDWGRVYAYNRDSGELHTRSICGEPNWSDLTIRCPRDVTHMSIVQHWVVMLDSDRRLYYIQDGDNVSSDSLTLATEHPPIKAIGRPEYGISSPALCEDNTIWQMRMLNSELVFNSTNMQCEGIGDRCGIVHCGLDRIHHVVVWSECLVYLVIRDEVRRFDVEDGTVVSCTINSSGEPIALLDTGCVLNLVTNDYIHTDKHIVQLIMDTHVAGTIDICGIADTGDVLLLGEASRPMPYVATIGNCHVLRNPVVRKSATSLI